MPRYFFNIQGDGYPWEDEDGTVLAGAVEARAAMVIFAGELLQGAGDTFWSGGDWRMRVSDEQDATVGTLTITGTSGH